MPDATGVGHVSVGQTVSIEVAFALHAPLHRLKIGCVGQPVRVAQELVHAIARNENLEVRRMNRHHGFGFLCRRYAGGFVEGWLTEDVVARNDILRTQRLPMIVAVLYIVEHAQLLQVLAILERTVLNHHLQFVI